MTHEVTVKAIPHEMVTRKLAEKMRAPSFDHGDWLDALVRVFGFDVGVGIYWRACELAEGTNYRKEI